MSFYVDTASIRSIEDMSNFPFVSGVTTNPKLIAKALGVNSVAKEHYFDHLLKIKKACSGRIFVQTNNSQTEEIIREAEELHDLIGEQLAVKIPVTLPGLQAMAALSDKNIPTAATAVFTGIQGLLALQCGAEYVIPYYSRIMNIMNDGLEVIADILDLAENGGYDAKVLVASLKSPLDVLEVLRSGATAVTLPPDLLSSVINNTHTLSSALEFQNSLTVVESK